MVEPVWREEKGKGKEKEIEVEEEREGKIEGEEVKGRVGRQITLSFFFPLGLT